MLNNYPKTKRMLHFYIVYPYTSHPIAKQGVTPNRTIIEDDVWIGGNSCINQGITIGTHCIIALGSVVTKSIPTYSIVGGNSARILKQYDFERKEWIKVQKDRYGFYNNN